MLVLELLILVFPPHMLFERVVLCLLCHSFDELLVQLLLFFEYVGEFLFIGDFIPRLHKLLEFVRVVAASYSEHFVFCLEQVDSLKEYFHVLLIFGYFLTKLFELVVISPL